MPPLQRVAFVLIDGLGDVSIPELGNRTPLEAAHTPFLDAIAGGWRILGYSSAPDARRIRRAVHQCKRTGHIACTQWSP